jgi:hypothetical protein
MNADFFEKEEVLFHNHEASQLNSSDIQVNNSKKNL